jgi:hypothetical protein
MESLKQNRKNIEVFLCLCYTCERLKIPTASAVGQRKQVLPARVYVKSNARRYKLYVTPDDACGFVCLRRVSASVFSYANDSPNKRDPDSHMLFLLSLGGKAKNLEFGNGLIFS